MEDIFYNDEKTGRIIIRRSGKAKRISIRIKDGGVILTIPQKQRTEEGIRFLKTKYDWILPRLKKEKTKAFVFDENAIFRTATFELKISKSPLSTFNFKLTNGLLTILYPQNQDICSENSQSIIRMGIERAMRMEAKRLLPARLAYLAGKFGFSYSNVTVRASKTRWGSCSSGKNISLSYFLMTLPDDLIDYVLLHELCHTKEMNHSVRFWKLMDFVTDNKSKVLRIRLKDYKTYF